MNHTYSGLVLTALLASTVTDAQWTRRPNMPTWAEPGHIHKAGMPLHGQPKAGGDVIFSEDFANGLAGNNQVGGAWTRSGPDATIWQYTTTGPNSAYANASNGMNSTTGSNGWMLFDVGRSNSDTTQNPPGGLTLAEMTSRDGYLESPVLDLGINPHLHLEYETDLAYCCAGESVFFVDISTDGGSNWPTRFTGSSADHFVNFTLGTYSMSLDLYPALQAGTSNVKIRFGWEGSAAASGMPLYFLQVDDVKITESYNTDLSMTNPAFNAYLPFGSTQFSEFEKIPQPLAWEMNMGSPVKNNGAIDATNVNMNYVVTRDGNQVYTTDVNNGTVAPSALDSNYFAPYTPDAIGAYTLDLQLTSDSTDAQAGDNSSTREWEMTDYVYAQDDNGRDDVINNNTGDTPPNGQEYYACNFFWIENDITLYAIQAALANGSTNSEVDGVCYGTVLDQDFVDLGLETLPFTIANTQQLCAANQAKFQSLIFEPPMEIAGGQEVCACVHYYGGTELVSVATGGVGTPGQSLYMTANATGSRFLQIQTPMVRLNFNPSVGIEEADYQSGIGMGQNLPNPADGTTTIPYELKEASTLTFEVHDMSGKLVATQAVGKRPAGTHRLKFDASILNEGLYLYSLTTNGTRLTKRMTVIR